MTWLEICLLAVALAADAFTVGAAVGVRFNGPRQVFRLTFHFGLFQSLLTWIGALAGSVLFSYIRSVDHWIVAAILVFIGGRMIVLAFNNHPQKLAQRDLTRGLSLVGLSLAVSIDALAAGLTLPGSGTPIWRGGLIIGLVAATATFVGMHLAGRISKLLGRYCEIGAGLVLAFLGIYTIIAHMYSI